MAALAGTTSQYHLPSAANHLRHSLISPTSSSHKHVRHHLHQRSVKDSHQRPSQPPGTPVFRQAKELTDLSISAIIPKGCPTGQEKREDGRILPENAVARAYVYNLMHGLSAFATNICIGNDLSVDANLPQPYNEFLFGQTIVVNFGCTTALAKLLFEHAAPHGDVLPLNGPVGDFFAYLQHGKNQPTAREYATSNLPPAFTDGTMRTMLSQLGPRGLHIISFKRATAFHPTHADASRGILPLAHGSRATITIRGPHYPRPAEPMQVGDNLVTVRFRATPPKHLFPPIVATAPPPGGAAPNPAPSEVLAAMVQSACAAVPGATPVAAAAGVAPPTGGAAPNRMPSAMLAAMVQSACAAVPGAAPAAAAAGATPARAAASTALAGIHATAHTAGASDAAAAAAVSPPAATADATTALAPVAPRATQQPAPSGAHVPGQVPAAVEADSNASSPATADVASPTCTAALAAPAGPPAASTGADAPTYAERHVAADVGVDAAMAGPSGVAPQPTAVPCAMHTDPRTKRSCSPPPGESEQGKRPATGHEDMQQDSFAASAQRSQPFQPSAATRAAAKRATKAALHRQRGSPSTTVPSPQLCARRLTAVRAATNAAAGALIESFNVNWSAAETREVIHDRLSLRIQEFPDDTHPGGTTATALCQYAARVTAVTTRIAQAQYLDHTGTVHSLWDGFVSRLCRSLETEEFSWSKFDNSLLRLEGRVTSLMTAPVSTTLASTVGPPPPTDPPPQPAPASLPGSAVSHMVFDTLPQLPPLSQSPTPSLTLILDASPAPSAAPIPHLLVASSPGALPPCNTMADASQSLEQGSMCGTGPAAMCIDGVDEPVAGDALNVLNADPCHPIQEARGAVEGTGEDRDLTGSSQQVVARYGGTVQSAARTVLPGELPQPPNHCTLGLSTGAPPTATPAMTPEAWDQPGVDAAGHTLATDDRSYGSGSDSEPEPDLAPSSPDAPMPAAPRLRDAGADALARLGSPSNA